MTGGLLYSAMDDPGLYMVMNSDGLTYLVQHAVISRQGGQLCSAGLPG